MMLALLRSRGIGSRYKILFVAAAFLVAFSIFTDRSLSGLLTRPDSFKFTPINREIKSLPDFTNGGIIVFYHIYKTGGSTVGKLLHELSRKDLKKDDKMESYEDAQLSSSKYFFTMIRKHIGWEKDCLTTLDLAEKQKKLVLLELHIEYPAPEFPSLVELGPILEKWRAEADRRGVGFFAFTLIREPVSHALSFFNFFHVGNKIKRPPQTKKDHDYWNPFRPLLSTETNFLKSYFANNRQCRMLNSDPQSTRGAPDRLLWEPKHRSREDDAEISKPCRVDKVHEMFFSSLDWVGTTENLQNETLPLLTKLVANDPSIGRKNKPFKVFDRNPAGYVGMKKTDLSNGAMDTILEKTKLDRDLYAEVTRNFRLTDLGWDYRSDMNG